MKQVIILLEMLITLKTLNNEEKALIGDCILFLKKKGNGNEQN